MPKKMKPGQRCTNSLGVCGAGEGHFYHAPFDRPLRGGENPRCTYVEPDPNTATRAQVYAAIDGERTYQDSKWNPGTTESGGKHSVLEFLAYMRDYVEEAMHFSARNPDPAAREFALNSVRKVAALGVACMEQNGARLRVVGRP